MSSVLSSLAERIANHGADRELDATLHYELGPRQLRMCGPLSKFLATDMARRCPRYTESIDDALRLIERVAGAGVEWDATTLYGIARVSVGLNLNDGDETGEDKGGSVPIALCLAALKIAQRERPATAPIEEPNTP